MLSGMPKTTLVIPCYNEEKRLNLAAFNDAIEKYSSLNLCFVDDGSRDNTLQLLQNAFAQNDRVKIISQKKNAGKAVAVRSGILNAIHDDESELVGFWDADLATPLSELEHFLHEFQKPGIELVIGCRFRRMGSDVKRKTSRHYLGRVFATAVSLLLAMPVYDTQCGAKVMRTELAEKIFANPFISPWLFDVELLKRMKELKGIKLCEQSIIELPLRRWNDIDGSKLSATKMFFASLTLCRIFTKRG